MLIAANEGAQQCDAIAVRGRSLTVSVRAGALEDMDQSEGTDIGLRVMVGQRQACVSSSDHSDRSLQALAGRAVAMAKLAPEDPFCGLAPTDRLAKKIPSLDLYDETEPGAQQLLKTAKALDAAANAAPHIKQAEGAYASSAKGETFFMTSGGFSGGWQSSRAGHGVSAIAEKNGKLERDYDMSAARFLRDLKPAEDIARSAAVRAAARLGSIRMQSGAMPVLFDRRVATQLLSALIGAISGPAIARGVSFLKDAMGKQVFANGIDIIDAPLRPRGLGSRPFDGEGVAQSQQYLVKEGVVQSWLLNGAAARKLDLITTGHAKRTVSAPPGVSASNTHISAGKQDPAYLMANMHDGLLVTEMFGPSLNSNTGDYSVGVAGFAIRGGAAAEPVSEITIAGNLRDMFRSMTPANDLEFEFAANTPSLLVEQMVIAGE